MPRIPPITPGESKANLPQHPVETSALQTQAEKVEITLGKKGSATDKMQTAPREKIRSGPFAWLVQFGLWVKNLFAALLGSKTAPAEPVAPMAPAIPVDRKEAFAERFLALPADQQRQLLTQLMDYIEESGELGRVGMFRLSGEQREIEDLQENLLSQCKGQQKVQLPDGIDLDNVANAFKRFFEAHVHLTDEGYAALTAKREAPQTPDQIQNAILEGLDGEEKAFMEEFFDFFRAFAAEQSQKQDPSKQLKPESVGMLFSISFIRPEDQKNPLQFIQVQQKVIATLVSLIPKT